MELSAEAADLLQRIFDGAPVPDNHFLAFAPWHPLIYGADGPQRVYLDTLLDWHGDQEHRDMQRFPKANHPFVSNYYIDWTGAAGQGTITNAGFRRRRGRLFDVVDAGAVRQEYARRGFANRYNESKLRLGPLTHGALDADPGRAQKILGGIRKDNPALAPTLQNLRDGEFAHQIGQFAVRRACKFLIYEGVRNGRVIAYAIDDLNMNEVVSRTPRELDDSPGRFKLPVCTSELREIFRRWDYLAGWVRFFVDLQQVRPPWHRDRTADELRGWAAYAAARAAKLAQRLPPQHVRQAELAQVQLRFQQNAYGQAIDLFHAAKPSELQPLPSSAWDA